MAVLFHRIKNFHVSVREIQNRVIFLRKIKAGGSEHSFGIHVAKMAGMPATILERADELLQQLEESHVAGEIGKPSQVKPTMKGPKRKKMQLSHHSIMSSDQSYQLSFIQLDDPLLQQIKEDILNTQINSLTPVEALLKLNEIKKLLEKK
jgi:DNA mismatch repair protein MutS